MKIILTELALEGEGLGIVEMRLEIPSKRGLVTGQIFQDFRIPRNIPDHTLHG